MRRFLFLLFFIFLNSLYAFTCGGYYLFDTAKVPNPEVSSKYRDSSLSYLLGVPVGTGTQEFCWGDTGLKRDYHWGGEDVIGSYTTSFYYKQYLSNPCTLPDVYNPDTYTCDTPPPDDLDDDNDGTPNKCDPDYFDFSAMDCDGDGINNDTDTDIDGDGIPNINDTNPFVAGAEDYSVSCDGADTSSTSSLPFSFSTYKFYGNLEEFRCGNLLLNSVYDSAVSLSDKNAPYCEVSYCYVHEVKNECTFDASWYRPASNWDYVQNKTESECSLLVDGIKYSSDFYHRPDTLKCSNVGFCYLKRIDEQEDSLPTETNSEDNDESMREVDLNSTTSDLAPLLNAQNTTNKHLQDLKDKTDYSNKRLDDLKELSKDTLDNNKQMKGVLDSLKSNSDSSLTNQLQALSSLSSIKDNIGTMSDTVTGNQVIGNGHLSDISGKMTTNNTLLTDIKDSLSGDGSTPDTSSFDDFESLLSGDNDFIDFVTSEFGTFKDNILSNFGDIENQYNDAKALFENPLSAPTLSGNYSSSCFSFTMLGKSINLDMSYLGVISPIVYFVMTSIFMILNFKFLLNFLLKGNE